MENSLKEKSTTTEREIAEKEISEVIVGVTCSAEGQEWEVGSKRCVNHVQYVCANTGQWTKTGKSC